MTSDPDQIRDSIERTQRNLSADVDALTEKVSPPRIAQRRVEQTRSTLTSIKDKIMGSASDRASTVTEAVSSSAASARDAVTDRASATADAAGSVPEQVRQRAAGNPLAAGLIAFGAGWLLSSLLPATEPERQVASQVKDLATDSPVAEQLGQAGQQAARQLRESAQQHVESVKETVADAASTAADETRSQAAGVASHAQQAGSRVAGQASPGDD